MADPWDTPATGSKSSIPSDAGGDDESVEFDPDAKSAFTVLEDGRYLTRLVRCEGGTSREGNPKLVATWEVLAPESSAGEEVSKHAPLTGAGAGIGTELIRSLNGGTLPAGNRFAPRHYLGRQYVLEVRKAPFTMADGRDGWSNDVVHVEVRDDGGKGAPGESRI